MFYLISIENKKHFEKQNSNGLQITKKLKIIGGFVIFALAAVCLRWLVLPALILTVPLRYRQV